MICECKDTMFLPYIYIKLFQKLFIELHIQQENRLQHMPEAVILTRVLTFIYLLNNLANLYVAISPSLNLDGDTLWVKGLLTINSVVDSCAIGFTSYCYYN